MHTGEGFSVHRPDSGRRRLSGLIFLGMAGTRDSHRRPLSRVRCICSGNAGMASCVELAHCVGWAGAFLPSGTLFSFRPPLSRACAPAFRLPPLALALALPPNAHRNSLFHPPASHFATSSRSSSPVMP